jgi:hypothetical protein
LDLRAPFRLALKPIPGFAAEAAAPAGPGQLFLRMLLWRTVLGWIDGAFAVWGFASGYASLRALEGRFWNTVLEAMAQINSELAVEDLRALAAELPPLPALSRLLIWMLPLVPLGVASAWLHNVVWDHGCLWLLRGVPRKGAWRPTLRAESSAMWVGSAGVVIGLLGHAPVAGLLLGPVLGAMGAYFWLLRGVALAAFHGCPVWKGVAATVLHVVLALGCGCGTIFLAWQLALRMAAAAAGHG